MIAFCRGVEPAMYVPESFVGSERLRSDDRGVEAEWFDVHTKVMRSLAMSRHRAVHWQAFVADALVVAHKLLEAVRALELCGREGLSCGVSVSIGLGVYPEHALSVAALMEYTDQGLRSVKRLGKDCIVMGSLATRGRA